LLTDQPDMTLLSVGHRPELESFHTRKIELARRTDGAKLVRDVELGEPTGQAMRRLLRRWSGRAYRPAT
jgi:putative ATP-binding cassette transporter